MYSLSQEVGFPGGFWDTQDPGDPGGLRDTWDLQHLWLRFVAFVWPIELKSSTLGLVCLSPMLPKPARMGAIQCAYSPLYSGYLVENTASGVDSTSHARASRSLGSEAADDRHAACDSDPDPDLDPENGT